MTAVAAPSASPSRWDLFTAFLKIGALGFGGVAAQARHVLVVERKLLDERGFAEAFGLASTLPGANTVNLATMLGDRYHGVSGVGATLVGLMGVPLAILTVAAVVYSRFHGNPDVEAALSGAAAAAAGLVAGTSVRILQGANSGWVANVVAAAVCCAALAHIPMLLVLAVGIPASVGIGVLRRNAFRA